MSSAAEVFYIAGDICPTKGNEALFASGEAEKVFDEPLLRRLRESRGLVFNLETALSDSPNRIRKSGPCLIAKESVARTLKKLNPICVCMANNHIVDSGPDGFARTVEALRKNQIPYFGASYKIEDASRPHIFEMAGKVYAIYACAEHEFTICDDVRPGANPFNPFRTYDDISKIALQVDKVIVLYHGMKEHYRYPSPEVAKRCRRMVDAGAALVCCQHSHCIGCAEKRGSSVILYGQGNFCFAKSQADEIWSTGLLVAMNSNDEIEFIPVRSDATGVRMLNNTDANEVLAEFWKRSEEVLAPGFVESNWEAFCCKTADRYALQLLNAVLPGWLYKFICALCKLRLCSPRLATGARSADFLNMLQCEAHNEVLRTYLWRHLDD